MIFSKDELQLTSIVGQGASTVLSSSSLIQIIILGESGLVYKGYLDTAIGKELVAIKTAKGRRTIIITQMYSYYALILLAALSSSGDVKRLTKEMSTMLTFEHTNAMSLVGVCIDGDMPLLIMPFMTNGSVLEYVKHYKEEILCINAKETEVGC